MSRTGLPIFDDTIQQTNRWLKEIIQHVGDGTPSDDIDENTRKRSYNALRAVLLTLRDRLPTALSANLAVQLPLLVRGIYFDQYEPEEQPKTYRADGEFYAHVDQNVDPQFHFGAEDSTRAVFAVLTAHLPEGTVEKIRKALPEDVRTVWGSLEAA
jgi:uncharacterized protein (DUF2267 family)